MHVQLFFPDACFFNGRARGTKRGGRTVDDTRPTFFPQHLFLQCSSARDKERKKDSRRLGSSLPPRSNPELSGAVAKYVHQEWFTLFYMGHVQTLHGQSRYHRQLNNIPNWQIKMTVQDRADWFARGLLKCIR